MQKCTVFYIQSKKKKQKVDVSSPVVKFCSGTKQNFVLYLVSVVDNDGFSFSYLTLYGIFYAGLSLKMPCNRREEGLVLFNSRGGVYQPGRAFSILRKQQIGQAFLDLRELLDPHYPTITQVADAAEVS